MSNVLNFNPDRVARLRSCIVNAADVQPVMEMRHLVNGWLSEGALSVLYGPSNTGKTFVALSVGAHVAAGIDWWGHKVRQMPVLYMALEGGVGFTNRIAAIKEAVPDLAASRNLWYIGSPMDLYQEVGVTELCDALPEVDFGLIVVDTLARAMAGGDDSSGGDMGHFVANMDRLREITGAHVLIIHHSGKDETKGARGSTVLKGAVDTEIFISNEGEVRATKQRDMPRADPLYFDLESVSFGISSEGDEVTSAVAKPTDAPSRRQKPLSGQAEVALQALLDAIAKHGETKRGTDFPHNRKCVHIDHWREMCERKGLTSKGTTKNAQSQAFGRQKNKLMETDHIRIQDDFVWRVAEDD